MRAALVVSAAAAVVAPVVPSPARAAGAQTVVSSTGLVAQGYVPDVPFADGSVRWLSIMLVVPEGSLTSAGSVQGVDLTRPWAVVTETLVTDPASHQTANGMRVCSAAENPAGWTAGGLDPVTMAWRGTSVVVQCPDGSGYQSYRFTWDAASDWLITNPALSQLMGGQVTTWSAPPLSGSVQAVPSANQQTRLTVCASGGPSGAACFGQSSGVGAVMPDANGVVADGAEAAAPSG